MSATNPPTDLNRIAPRHLESLRRAGVESLPTAPSPAAAAPEPGQQPTLFAEPDAPPPAPVAVLPVEERRVALTILAQQVSGCTRCAHLVKTRTQTVFGV